MIGRRSIGAGLIGEYEIPAGLLMSLYARHRHPEYFPEPTVFDRTRWLKTPRPFFRFGADRGCVSGRTSPGKKCLSEWA
jgi:cytochrome P450